MEKIVASRGEMSRGDPVEILFLRAIIVGAIEKGDETHRMPAERLNQVRWYLILTIVVSDRASEKSSPMGGSQGLESIRVQSRASDPREDRIEQMPGKDA